MAAKTAKSSVPSPRDTQAVNLKALGGMPPQKEVKAIMEVNTPGARKAAPASFRPKS